MEQNPGVLSIGPKLLVCFSGSLNGRAFSIISRKEDYLGATPNFLPQFHNAGLKVEIRDEGYCHYHYCKLTVNSLT